MIENLVTIPQWVFWLLVLFASVSIVRLIWLLLLQYFRGQSLKTRRRLDEQLEYGLSPHTLKSRAQWKTEILNSPTLGKALNSYVELSGITEEAARVQVDEYLEEIAPSFNVLLYFRIGFWVARAVIKSLYTIHVGYADTTAYNNIGKNTCVMVVSNHRSNFDPLIHIYLTARRSTISFSAGEWAQGWPFRQFFHAIGFYIVRRDSNEPLYRTALEHYIIQSVAHCIPLGLFLEGGLSRDGTLQKLKLGTLNYAIKALGQGQCEDIVVIPAAISYDKIPEDKTLLEHKRSGFRNKGRFYSLLSFLQFIAGTGFKMFQRRYKAFGYACVNYGEPISIVAWQKKHSIEINKLPPQQRRESITALGELFGERINALMPVPPISILSDVIIRHPEKTISPMHLKAQAYKIISELRDRNSALVLPEIDDDFAFEQGISILAKHHILDPSHLGQYRIADGQEVLLEYYARILKTQRGQ